MLMLILIITLWSQSLLYILQRYTAAAHTVLLVWTFYMLLLYKTLIVLLSNVVKCIFYFVIFRVFMSFDCFVFYLNDHFLLYTYIADSDCYEKINVKKLVSLKHGVMASVLSRHPRFGGEIGRIGGWLSSRCRRHRESRRRGGWRSEEHTSELQSR